MRNNINPIKRRDTVAMVFSRQWYEFIKPMRRDEGVRFMFKIVQYGAAGIEPTGLPPKERNYFDNVIRPQLDRQIKQKK